VRCLLPGGDSGKVFKLIPEFIGGKDEFLIDKMTNLGDNVERAKSI